MASTNGKLENLEAAWKTDPRWAGIKRPYSAQDVDRLRGSVRIEHTMARLGAERLWSLLHSEPYTAALGAMTGNQAVQQVAAGLKAIYVSGWQVAADANDAGQMYPDQSLYPADSVPNLLRRLNASLMRADQIHHAEGRAETHWFAPLVADAEAANLITSDVDPRDREFITGERTAEGFFRVRGGTRAAIARALAYAPYVDMIWCETSTPDIADAREFADGLHAKFPGKMLAYNCSPSFNWRKNLDDATIASFQRELGRLGYKFQFITLAGFHALNHAMFELARGYKSAGMSAYCKLQDAEFESEDAHGYAAVRHQRFVGTGYFDAVQEIVTGGTSSTKALEGSTEAAQFANADEEDQLPEPAKARG